MNKNEKEKKKELKKKKTIITKIFIKKNVSINTILY